MSSSTVDSKRPKLDIGILTHSGTHHADEALAVNLLRKLDQFKHLPLTRTRDPALISQATIVVDVGAEYDAERLRFDHHQRGFEEVFDKEHTIKLSSAGLVWKHFGPQIISAHLSLPASSPTIPLLHLKLYDDFIQAIDGIDNGIPQHPSSTPSYISKTDLSSRVAHLNPSWNETSSEEDSNLRFEKASSLAGGEFFDRLDYAFKSWLPAREIVENAIKDRVEKSGDKEGRVLVFDGYASWKDHLFSLEKVLQGGIEGKILYVVYPDESNKWRIQCVPESIDSFVSRKGLPEEWRGLRDQVLTEKMGIQGGIFVHASGFIGGNQTREGALEMAQKALEM